MCLFLDLNRNAILTPDFTPSLRGLGKLNNVAFLDEFTYQRKEAEQKAICSFFFSLFQDLETGQMQTDSHSNSRASDRHFHSST